MDAFSYSLHFPQASQIPVGHQMTPNPMHPGNLQQQVGESAAQGIEQAKKQQYEEQQRKLREISSRGIKSKSKGGKNLIDDFMSKTDLNLSSNLKQHSKSATPAASTQGNRQMSVFSGKNFQLYVCHLNKMSLSIVSKSYTVKGTVCSKCVHTIPVTKWVFLRLQNKM